MTQNARVAAFVTFYYRPHTMQFLHRVLRNLSDLSVERVQISVVTNLADTAPVGALCATHTDDFEVLSFPNLQDPLELTWMHKAPLRLAVLRSPGEFTHFLYLEDDIGFTNRNFEYFNEYASSLGERGLIPGFLRTEFSHAKGLPFATDATELTVDPYTLAVSRTTFASPRFPYQAFFLMNRALANEYLASRSFDLKRSREINGDWGARERASMGLCLENVPDTLASRYVLPLRKDGSPDPMCWVDHMAANYANSAPNSPLGKLPISKVFLTTEPCKGRGARDRNGGGTGPMYLLTHHGHLVGTNGAAELVQVDPVPDAQHTFVEIQDTLEDQLIESGPLAGFRASHRGNGVCFQRNGKFLCAEPGGGPLVANREVASLWETFVLVSEATVATLKHRFETSRSIEGEVARLHAVVMKLVNEGNPVKIHCGCGPVPRDGFLNFDISVMAPRFLLTSPDEYFIFPFAEMPWDIPSDCVDYIFHEDFIEHITQLQQIQFLAETWRVLKPGCYHRVNTPNLITSMRRHSVFKDGFTGIYTGELQWGHKSLFSPASLKEMAELVGYTEVTFMTKSHGVSPFAVPDFRPASDRDEIVGNIYADLRK